MKSRKPAQLRDFRRGRWWLSPCRAPGRRLGYGVSRLEADEGEVSRIVLPDPFNVVSLHDLQEAAFEVAAEEERESDARPRPAEQIRCCGFLP